MTQGLQEVQHHDLAIELERAVLPRLLNQLQERAAGHCMRVTDLDNELMTRLCGRLTADAPEVRTVVLDDGSGNFPSGIAVTPTKLVELRNPLPDGTLGPPLLVFIPSQLRTAAEDSFGVATFEALDLGDAYGEVERRLLAEMPNGLRTSMAEIIGVVRGAGDPWPFADQVAVARFLLTAKLNGFDAEAIGAALFELALVPDFELLTPPNAVRIRVKRNLDCVRKLTWSAKSERGRVLELGLSDRAFRIQLGNFLAETGLEDPGGWTRRIVRDRAAWPLAFNRWPFEEDIAQPESIFIGEVETDLPMATAEMENERLNQIVGQRFLPLGPNGLRRFRVTFRVDPEPGKVSGLARFRLQVVSKEQGPVGLVRSKSTWGSSRKDASVTFTNIGKVDWQEGWHFVRVLAETEAGDLLALVDEHGNTVPWAEASDSAVVPRPNESELFYVLPALDEEIEIEILQRAIQRETSLTHARLRQQFSAILDDRDPGEVAVTSVGWTDRTPRSRGSGADLLEVKFSRAGSIHVPVARPLKVLEQRILATPDGPISWHMPVSLGSLGAVTGDAREWPRGDAAGAFLETRRRFFDAIRQAPGELVMQAADLEGVRQPAVAYAECYVQLIQTLLRQAEAESGAAAQEALVSLRRVLGVDSVLLAIRDHRGRRREAAILAPTHPLRALWLVAWAEVARRWLEAARAAPREFVAETRDSLLRYLAPVGFPPVLVTSAGRSFVAVDNIHPFWTLYAPPAEEDPRGLVGDVCAALSLPEPAIGGAAIDGEYLAARVRRYLSQHPYVDTLVINAFNAGRAAVLADMLLQIQRDSAHSDMHYDIRLFAPDPEAPGLGEALVDLLSPTATVTGKEADAFATRSDSHLRPKLALALRQIGEFRQSPEEHPSHLSLLFDLFPPEQVGASPANSSDDVARVFGLIQDYTVGYSEDEALVAWRRQPRHGEPLPIPGAEELTDLLSVLPELMSSAAAAVATGQVVPGVWPVITLALDSDERALLHQVHEVSDWVLTLDRNMGIEFFDHGGLAQRPEYLIDHSPDLRTELGHRLFVTSRSVEELEAILQPVLTQFGLKAERQQAVAVLDQLRSLSGRLALKLISAPSQRAEALGLALCRMYLDHQGCLENQVVVPLDAHLELYAELKIHAEEAGRELSFKRTDLALFDLDAGTRTITCRLVEVKCYSEVGDIGAYNQLKESVATQITQSEQVLATHFDPDRCSPDRADRLIKSRELAILVEFYLDRAVRYGLMAEDAANEARFLLGTLEEGYQLRFTRSAIVFDFAKPGTDPPDTDSGIEYHRVGIDLIRQLVEAAAAGRGQVSEAASDSSGGIPPAGDLPPARPRRLHAPSVPLVERLAFLAAPRDRTLRRRPTKGRPIIGVESPGAVATTSEPESPQDARPPAGPAEGESSGERAVTKVRDEVRAGGVPESMSSDGSADLREPGRLTPECDVLIGVTGTSPQYGVLGEVAGRKVGIDLNQTHTISLFGVQGGGKSYTLGSIVEMATQAIESINRLPQPLATVIFHYSPTMDYRPEFTSMVAANSNEAEVSMLRERFAAEPKGLPDVLLVAPADKLDERREEFPSIEVVPLKFAAAELQASHWRFLMGAVGSRATYIRQLNRVMKTLRHKLTISSLRKAIEAAELPDHLKELARMRLDLAAEYIDDRARLSSLIRPGRLIIVDLRDEFIEKDEALGLFVVLLQLFADAQHDGRPFNKLVVFDEAHKYIDSPDLVSGLVDVVREMRHKGTSVMVASQDPPSVPVSLIELSSQVILHRFNSPAWLKHVQKANAALAGLSPDKMADLGPGEAYVWSSKATDSAFSRGAVKIRCRPRVTQHGGATKTAL